ncbi:hypothetical protein EMIT051CA3_21113 [Pseudomonas chlororaphis]
MLLQKNWRSNDFPYLRDTRHALAFTPTGNVPMQGLAIVVGMISVPEASHKQCASSSFFSSTSAAWCEFLFSLCSFLLALYLENHLIRNSWVCSSDYRFI